MDGFSQWAIPLVILVIFYLRKRGEPEIDWTPIYLLLAFPVLGISLLVPGLGERVYIWVIRFFAIFGWVISHVGLTLIFYIVIAPMAFALRATGKIEVYGKRLRQGGKPEWNDHADSPQAERYYRLF